MVSNDRSIHFAIPSKSEIEEVELLWPSGKRDIYRAQPFVNSMWLCVEGQGIYKIQDYQSGK